MNALTTNKVKQKIGDTKYQPHHSKTFPLRTVFENTSKIANPTEL